MKVFTIHSPSMETTAELAAAQPVRRMYGARAAAVGLCLLALPACFTTAVYGQSWGDTATYVNITNVKIEDLPNAVRIILEADGTLNTFVDLMNFWHNNGRYWEQTERKDFRFILTNARSQVGQLVTVDKYPVSHVTFAVPSEAREGVGLEIALMLFNPGRIGKIQLPDRVADWTQRWFPLKVDMLLSDDKRKLIMTVHREYHREPVVDEGASTAKERLLLEGADGGYRLQVVNKPLTDVLNALSTETGAQIQIGPGIDRRLTANLPTTPMPELLETLCRITCLHMAEHDGVYYVSPGTVDDVAAYWTAPSRRIRLNSISVDDAMRILPSFVLRHLHADVESNTLTAYGPPPLLDKLEADLMKIDATGMQIKISALVVQIRRPRESSRIMEALLEGGNTSTELAPLSGRLNVQVVDKSLDRIRLDLQALRLHGTVEAHVEPDIVVANGRVARVFVGKEQFYKYLRPTWRGNELELRRVSVGVRLEATPWTGDGRSISVPFQVASDSIIGSHSGGLPLVSRQQAEGNLRIRTGECIIFGGLQTRERASQKQEFPSIMESPIMGGTLRAVTRIDTVNEILVCISAEVVPTSRGPSQTPAS